MYLLLGRKRVANQVVDVSLDSLLVRDGDAYELTYIIGRIAVIRKLGSAKEP